MAAPQLSEAYIKNPEKIVLSFDQPIDDSVAFQPTSFSINYGRIPISSAEYYGTAQIVLVLGQAMLASDKLEVNYQPPDDISAALRGTLPANPSGVQIRRAAVRAFYKVPVKNLLRPDENAWTANSNLGGGKQFVPDFESPEFDGSNIPSIDICGDGSIIIGKPPSTDGGTLAEGAITGLRDRVAGSGYTDGTYVNVSLQGGDGTGAVATLTIENGEVATVILSDGGESYLVDDVLTIDDADVGGGGGVDFSITVDTINVLATTTSGGSSRIGSVVNVPYPVYGRPSPRSATPDDFVLAFGLREAIQISNIDDADATRPNDAKIWMAIEDACALIDNYISGATRAGKVLISSNRRRTSLIIARYYLDTVRRREDVKSDYERAITELDKSRSLADISRPDIPWWADPCNPRRGGGVISHRIPQYYNGVSGKGLSGWWTDSGYSEVDDIRYDRDNAEGNNDSDNGVGSGLNEGRTPSQPTESGGSNDGGDTP